MIDVELEKTIKQLHSMGKSIRQINLSLHVGRNTIRRILRKTEKEVPRQTKIHIEEDLLRKVFKKCGGWGPRMRDVLKDNHGITVGYSTLMRLVHEYDLKGTKNIKRSGFVETLPGVEMQHDTSPYKIKINGVVTNITASLLYFRYSKQRYLKFYPHFKRFHMKCFFYEALQHYKYAAPTCVVDNTNLAVLRGTGQNAVFVPEMVNFARDLGFKWLAHEKGHANRKAGEERSFWTIETNFFPGRDFLSWEDLNEQALNWATVILAERPQTKDKIIPNIFFEQEKPLLTPVTDFVREPYLLHERLVDQYGGASFDGNHYWVPSPTSGDIQIIEYRDRILIYKGREFLVEYKLPSVGTKNKDFGFENRNEENKKRELKIKKMTHDEEYLCKELPEMGIYLSFALKAYHRESDKAYFLKELINLYRKLPKTIFLDSIERAQKYKITDVKILEKISIQSLRNALIDIPLPELSNEYEEREIYQEGRRSGQPDLNYYQSLLESNQEEEDKNG